MRKKNPTFVNQIETYFCRAVNYLMVSHGYFATPWVVATQTNPTLTSYCCLFIQMTSRLDVAQWADYYDARKLWDIHWRAAKQWNSLIFPVRWMPLSILCADKLCLMCVSATTTSPCRVKRLVRWYFMQSLLHFLSSGVRPSVKHLLVSECSSDETLQTLSLRPTDSQPVLFVSLGMFRAF